MLVRVTTYYLEMLDAAELRPAAVPTVPCVVVRLDPPYPKFNREMYAAVGHDWYWVDRLEWSLEQWREYAERPELETWAVYVYGEAAGYFELEAQPDGNVEIVYFGLLPLYCGKGIGGYVLTLAIRRAWEMGAKRVWVHTCSFDHPSALPNYQARGLRLILTKVSEKIPPRRKLPPTTS